MWGKTHRRSVFGCQTGFTRCGNQWSSFSARNLIFCSTDFIMGLGQGIPNNVYLDRCPWCKALPHCFVYHLHLSNHLCSCFENNTLPLLQQTVLPHQSFSPLSGSPINSAHYLMARSEMWLWSRLTDPPWPRQSGVTGLWWTMCSPMGLSAPFWSTWFIIHRCSCRGCTVISRRVPGYIPLLSVWGLIPFSPTVKIHLF